MRNSLTHQIENAPKYVATAWPEALENARALPSINTHTFDEILLLGCGDSFYAALAIEMAIANWTRSIVRAAPAMIAGRYLLPRALDHRLNRLVVGISSSGEVARTIEALELANNEGFQTVAITSNPESSLAKAADGVLHVSVPTMDVGPGILSYLASMLMGFALCTHLTNDNAADEIISGINLLPQVLERWGKEQRAGVAGFGDLGMDREPIVFLGSGPAYGSALFAAAKVVEATGVAAWGQELEEWAHLEYFCEPSHMPTWMLSSGGRTISRENELLSAAQAIGRNVIVNRWTMEDELPIRTVEILSPFGLWVAPSLYAAQLMEQLNEAPYRGFGGGRSSTEGGGASRIRSSARIKTLQEMGMEFT